MKSFAVRTFGQLGDTVILAGAVHNVRLEHPEFNFTFLGKPQYAQLLENNDDFSDHSFSRLLPLIRYGDVHDERNATKGTCVEGFTATLCDVLNIPHVPIRENRPRVLLSDSEREWAGQWNDCILINANCQTCSMSKAYPYWQEVVDGLGDYRIIQVGGNESRDISHELRGVEDMRGRTTVREFASMVYGCRAVISAPSGITNVASAFRKPQVVVNASREADALTAYEGVVHMSHRCSCGWGVENGCVHLWFDNRDARTCNDRVATNGREYSRCQYETPPEEIIEACLRSI